VSPFLVAEHLQRIAVIDRAFEGAAGWGPWMVETANEREGLVNRLRQAGHDIPHKWLARTASGDTTD
jgi:hypothetical protein